MDTGMPTGKSNSLIICSAVQELERLLDNGRIPRVVMLSAWDETASTLERMEPLLKRLLDAGCVYFVCAGRYSEELHDLVDDVIVEIATRTGSDRVLDVMTTWHDADTAEEVAHFFLNLTDVSDALVVALLEQGKPQDEKLKEALLSSISQ